MPLRLDLTNKIRASRKELFGGRCFSSSHFLPETLCQWHENDEDTTPKGDSPRRVLRRFPPNSFLMFHRFGFFPRQTSKPASITPNIHMRLNKVIKELNVSIQRVADALKDNGFEGEITLNTKITEEQYTSLKKNFADDINRKEEAEKRFHSRREEKRSSKEADAAHTVGDGEEATAQAAPKAEQAPQTAETAKAHRG